MPETVLVVEDDLPTCMLWSRHLTYAGWDVQIAHDVDGALTALLKYEPRAVILDVMLLDERSGWEVLRKICSWAWSKHITVMVISAVAVPERAYREGATAFLLKPCSPQVVVDRLTEELALNSGIS